MKCYGIYGTYDTKRWALQFFLWHFCMLSLALGNFSLALSVLSMVVLLLFNEIWGKAQSMIVVSSQWYICRSYKVFFLYIIYNNVYDSKFCIFCNKTRKSAIKTLIFLGKVLEIPEKVLPLHPLSRNNECSSKARVRVVIESNKRKSSLKDLR